MDWSKYDANNKETINSGPKMFDWSKYNITGTYNDTKDLMKTVDDYATQIQNHSFNKGWTSQKEANKYRSLVSDYYKYSKQLQDRLKRNADLYKNSFGEKAYNELLKHYSQIGEKEAEGLQSIDDVRSIYSQYGTAEDYDKAKREYGYSTKYQGKTYDDISKYLASDDYKTMRRSGLVSDEEDIWLKNFETNIATADQIQSKIDALGGSAEKIKNKIHNLNLDMDDLQLQYREGKITEQDYKARSLSIQNEIDNIQANSEKNIEKISELEVIKKQKQAQENLSKLEEERKNLETTATKAPDFKAKSNLQPGEYEDDIDKLIFGNKEERKDLLTKMAWTNPGGFVIDDIASYTQISDEQKKIYSYYKFGLKDENKAERYLKLIFQELANKAGQKIYKNQLENNTAFELLYNLGTNAASFYRDTKNFLNTEDEFLPYASSEIANQKAYQDLADEGFKIGDKSIAQIGADVSGNLARQLPSIALGTVPVVGTALRWSSMAASSAGSAYREALNSGYTQEEARGYSTAIGVSEATLDSLLSGIGKGAGKITGKSVETITKNINNAWARALVGGAFKSAGEFTEEYLQDAVVEPVLSNAFLGTNKDIDLLSEDALYAGFIGALSAGTTNVGGLIGASFESKQQNEVGTAILDADNGLQTLKDAASKTGDASIVKLAEKLNENSKPSDVGHAYNRIYEQSVEKSIDAMLLELTENGATNSGSNSARGWASQIIKTAIAPESDDKRSKANTLRANKVTSNVYAAFADDGKYGATTLFELNDLVEFKPATKEQIAENINQDIADSNELRELHRPTFGTNELPTEIRDNLNKISANGTSGTVSQIFGKNVAANLEKQRPAPKKSDKIKITPKGEKIVKQRGKAMGVKVIFTDDLVDGIGDGKTVDHKTVYISRYSVNPMKELIKHEFTHTTEISKLYSKFSKHIFNDSKAFNSWIKQKGYTSWSELADEIIETFHENDVSYEDEYDAAKREIVAMFVSENLFNEKTANEEITSDFLSELRQIDRAWYERFIDWVKSIFARLKTVDGIQRDIIKLEHKFLRLVETADRENAPKGTVYSESKNSNSQYMFAGPNAKTANKLTLATAKQWLKDGKDSELIRQETGWFKGYDGKWRFEISDKAADVDWKQAANDMLKILNFGYAREQLLQKNITSEEFAKVAKEFLEQKVNNKLLTDYMEHKELFEAYPELLKTRVLFATLGEGDIASYNANYNIITINTDYILMFTDGSDSLKLTLLHELQHAVQSIEGFSRGSSNVLWQERKKNGEQFLDSDGNEISDIDLYKRTAGEIEARDTQKRYKLTEAERKENRPNIDRDDVIFVEKDYSKTADGVQYSIPSDHVYSYNNGKASFTEDRLTALLDEHSLGDGKRADYSNAFVAYISPNDFVNLTSNDRIRGRVEEEAYILDKDELRNETETPFIEYNPETGEVVNHEGRHRMVALQAEGISDVAVVLKPSTDSFARLEPRDINLTGQNFAGGKAQGNITVKNAIPLSEKHRDETTAQFAQNPDADVRYLLPNIETKQQFDELLEEKYEVFSTKKPIKVTTAEWSSVNSLRTQRYGNIPEEDIPTIDYFEIGTYNKVNQGYVYFVRNSDKWNFSIVSKRKLRKAERSVDDGESSGSKINGTRTSKGFDKSSNTRSVGNGGAVQPNAFVFENETVSNERGNFDNWNDTSRGTVRSNRNEADPIDGPAYSLPDLDTEYMRYVDSWNKESAQKMVDNAAKEAGAILDENGNPLKLYRGTMGGQTVFKKETTLNGKIYTIDTIDIATNYGDKSGKATDIAYQTEGEKATYALYGFPKNMLTIDAQYGVWSDLVIPEELLQYSKGRYKATNAEIAEWAEKAGYDALRINNVRDGSFDTGSEIIFFDEKLVKSADAITKDNSGNVIPLSERFNTESEDIRYSLPAIPDIAKGKSNTELESLVKDGTITLDEAFEELVARHGAMKPGERPKVDVTLPNKISKTKHVMRWVRTAAESGHLDEGMRNEQRKEILNGAMTYQVISDKAAVQKADDVLRDDFAGAVQKWEDIINSGKQMTKFDIALGERLLQQAAENGHASDVIKYTAELAELGTRMGQNIQALRLLKKMTGIGKLYYIQRTVDSLNRDIEQKYGGKKPPVKIDPSFAKILANSKNSAEAETVEADMIKDIANQMPSTFLDKWNAWRYLSMLGNPRTHIRNIMGNAVFVPAIRIRHGLSYAGERFIAKDKRTKILGLLKPEYRDFARSDFEAMKDILTGGGKMNPSDKIRDQQKIFKTKALEIIRNKNFAFMEAEDMLFLKMHYVRALGSALQARGIDIANISDEQLNVARLYAIKEAQKATYRDASAVAEALNRFQYSNSNFVRAFGMLVEGILPFKKTPINILKRGVEYSPVGLVTSLTKGIVDLKKGKITADEFIDGISAGLTGTGIMALGMLLQSLGIIVGGLDYDDEDALERMSGAQPYSIQVGDISYTIDWMAPAVLPFLVGAEVEKFLESDNDRDPIGFALDALAAIGEPLTELSMLSGLNEAIEAAAYSDNELTDMAIAAGTSYLSQAVPTIGGQIARTFDDTRRSNFVDKNSAVPKGIQTAYQKALGKIPFAENTKVPYIDAWGRTEVNDNVLLRAFENFVSPGYVSVIDDDKVNKEIAEVYVYTGDSAVLPKRASSSIEVNDAIKNLTADEYVQYATDKGQYSRQYLEEVMSNSMYQGLSFEGKAAVISDLYSFSDAKAKSNVSDYDYTTNSHYKTAAKLEAAGISPSSYYIAREVMNEENADTDGSGTVSKKEKQKALKNAGFSNSEVNTIININKK